MNQDKQKTVLIGVTGCIAAYKSCELVRVLQKKGCRVKVVMTEHATQFVGPTTFRALTHEPVAVGLFDAPGDPIHHVSLAKECDLFVIAPCTANVIAKIASGMADDLLTTTALATKAPLLIAPAMNVNMFENPITQENIARLQARGVSFVAPDEGYLACGDVGRGRLAEVETIAEAVMSLLYPKQDLQGKRILITAGPTLEYIDPVRYISNPSSGKTGFALAEAAYRRGAEVCLVSGPVQLVAPEAVDLISITSAQEMYEQVVTRLPWADIVICSAAVSDYRPKEHFSAKLKKGSDNAQLSSLELVENPDILAYCGAHATTGQLIVGFAAETNNVIENAQKKLTSKGADLIVANEVGPNKGFGSDTNTLSLVSKSGVWELSSAPKAKLAEAILDKIVEISQ